MLITFKRLVVQLLVLSAVLYSRAAYKRFDDWRGYFCTTSVGASGLAFAMKVCTPHTALHGMYAVLDEL